MSMRGLVALCGVTSSVVESAAVIATQYGPCGVDNPGSTIARPACTVMFSEPSTVTANPVPPGRTPWRAPTARPSYIMPTAIAARSSLAVYDGAPALTFIHRGSNGIADSRHQ